jgi:hypothetical protein
MNKTAANELTEEGEKLYKCFRLSAVSGAQDLDSSIINKVAKDLAEAEPKYVFVENGKKRTHKYLSGIFSVFSKHVKDKMNNLTFKLVYITKNGFVEEFLERVQELNILKKHVKRRSLY